MDEKLDLSILAVIATLVIGLFTLFSGSGPPVVPIPAPAPEPPPVVTPTENTPPIALMPFVMGSAQWRQLTSIDLRHRFHGCDTDGNPTSQSGAFDPDGDLLEFRVTAGGPDADGEPTAYAIFDDDGNRIDGRWLPTDYFPVYPSDRTDPDSPLEQEAVVYCIIGCSDSSPPFVIVKRVLPRCDPTPVPPDPVTPIEPFGTFRIRYQVRDPTGAEAASGMEFPISSGPC